MHASGAARATGVHKTLKHCKPTSGQERHQMNFHYILPRNKQAMPVSEAQVCKLPAS
jgi:hypothetical protein